MVFFLATIFPSVDELDTLTLVSEPVGFPAPILTVALRLRVTRGNYELRPVEVPIAFPAKSESNFDHLGCLECFCFNHRFGLIPRRV